jgi:hypothetical protein
MDEKHEILRQLQNRVWNAVFSEIGFAEPEALMAKELRNGVAKHCFSKRRSDYTLGAVFAARLSAGRIEETYLTIFRDTSAQNEDIWEGVWHLAKIASTGTMEEGPSHYRPEVRPSKPLERKSHRRRFSS